MKTNNSSTKIRVDNTLKAQRSTRSSAKSAVVSNDRVKTRSKRVVSPAVQSSPEQPLPKQRKISKGKVTGNTQPNNVNKIGEVEILHQALAENTEAIVGSSKSLIKSIKASKAKKKKANAIHDQDRMDFMNSSDDDLEDSQLINSQQSYRSAIGSSEPQQSQQSSQSNVQDDGVETGVESPFTDDTGSSSSDSGSTSEDSDSDEEGGYHSPLDAPSPVIPRLRSPLSTDNEVFFKSPDTGSKMHHQRETRREEDEELREDDPRVQRLLNRLLDEREAARERSDRDHSSNRKKAKRNKDGSGKPSKSVEKSRTGKYINLPSFKPIKSPSDTTLYAPALNKGITGRSGMIAKQLIYNDKDKPDNADQISKFVEHLRLEDERRSQSREVPSHRGTPDHSE